MGLTQQPAEPGPDRNSTRPARAPAAWTQAPCASTLAGPPLSGPRISAAPLMGLSQALHHHAGACPQALQHPARLPGTPASTPALVQQTVNFKGKAAAPCLGKLLLAEVVLLAAGVDAALGAHACAGAQSSTSRGWGLHGVAATGEESARALLWARSSMANAWQLNPVPVPCPSPALQTLPALFHAHSAPYPPTRHASTHPPFSSS